MYWIIWGCLTLAIGGYFLYVMFAAQDKSDLLIGDATHGHYQIELACSSCHTQAFGGSEILQNACVDCHGEELQSARDSHPKKKFTDPRNADLLQVLDARYCVSCHTEHQQEQTRPIGLTIAGDYCFHCHVEIGEERPSHAGLAFDSCSSAGCHNFHDNRALFEDFLVDNAGGAWLATVVELTAANRAATHAPASVNAAFRQADGYRQQHPEIVRQVSQDVHGQAGLECGGCHSSDAGGWLENPGLAQCENCHRGEAAGFLAGKHGMRLAVGLDALQPGMSSMPFKTGAERIEHGCNSCHGAHDFDTRQASVEACLGCHDDSHSLAFPESPHGQLMRRALAGELPWSRAVTCATCHMPRLVQGKEDSQPNVALLGEAHGETIFVEHNQNMNLRPNEKMIRPVCMSCHNLEFSIDALADDNLIDNNFKGKPRNHVPSIDWALKRVQ